jgi:hypothetical protein
MITKEIILTADGQLLMQTTNPSFVSLDEYAEHYGEPVAETPEGSVFALSEGRQLWAMNDPAARPAPDWLCPYCLVPHGGCPCRLASCGHLLTPEATEPPCEDCDDCPACCEGHADVDEGEPVDAEETAQAA